MSDDIAIDVEEMINEALDQNADRVQQFLAGKSLLTEQTTYLLVTDQPNLPGLFEKSAPDPLRVGLISMQALSDLLREQRSGPIDFPVHPEFETVILWIDLPDGRQMLGAYLADVSKHRLKGPRAGN